MKKGNNGYFSRRALSNLFDRHLAFILHLTSRQHLLSSSSGPTGNVVKINTKEKEKRKSIYTIPEQQITSPLSYEISSPTTCETHCYKKRFLLIDRDRTEPDSIDINYLSEYGV